MQAGFLDFRPEINTSSPFGESILPFEQDKESEQKNRKASKILKKNRFIIRRILLGIIYKRSLGTRMFIA